MASIFSITLWVSSQVTSRTSVTLSIKVPSSYAPSPLLEFFFVLLTSNTHRWDGGCSSKYASSFHEYPTAKGKQTFLPYTYSGMISHASEKF